jgi:hypothetical protein
VYLPTYRLQSSAAPGETPPPVSLPTALVEGTLVEDEGCIWVEADGSRWLVLWPNGSTAVVDGGQVVVRNDGHQAIVGTHVSGGGGEYRQEHYAFVVGLIGEPVPLPCQASGLYVLGYNLKTIAN